MFAVLQTFLFKEFLYQKDLAMEAISGRKAVWPGEARSHGLAGIAEAVHDMGGVGRNEACPCGSARSLSSAAYESSGVADGEEGGEQCGEPRTRLERESNACFKVLSATQDQIRFADTKAAFLFGINHAPVRLCSRDRRTLKRALVAATVPPAAWVSLIALIIFVITAATAVVILIHVVMSRFGELAPTSRIFFGHIIKRFRQGLREVRLRDQRPMTELEWVEEVGTQIIEIHISH